MSLESKLAPLIKAAHHVESTMMMSSTCCTSADPFTLKVDTFTSLLRPTGALPKGALVGAGSVPAIAFTGSLTTPPCTAGVQW